MQHLPDSGEGVRPLVRLGRCHTSLNIFCRWAAAVEILLSAINQSLIN